MLAWFWRAVVAALVVVVATHLEPIRDTFTRAVATIADGALVFVIVAVAATFASVLVSAVVRQRTLRAAGGTIAFLPAAVAGVESGGIQLTTPAGGIVSTGYLFRRFTKLGISAPAVAWSLAITGAVTTTMVIGMTAVGYTIGAAPSLYNLAGGLAVAGALIGGSLWVVRHADLTARWCGLALTAANRLLRRRPDAGVAKLRASVTALGNVHPSGADWIVTLLGTMTSLAAGATCLWASAAAVGIPVSPVAAIVYFAVATAANNVGPLPAGLGVLDGILLAWLTTTPGASASAALGAVVLYRVVSAGPVIATGWTSILLRHHRDARTHRRSRHLLCPV